MRGRELRERRNGRKRMRRVRFRLLRKKFKMLLGILNKLFNKFSYAKIKVKKRV